VGGEVGGDDVDFLAWGLGGVQFGEKRDELGAGVALRGLAELPFDAGVPDKFGDRSGQESGLGRGCSAAGEVKRRRAERAAVGRPPQQSTAGMR